MARPGPRRRPRVAGRRSARRARRTSDRAGRRAGWLRRSRCRPGARRSRAGLAWRRTDQVLPANGPGESTRRPAPRPSAGRTRFPCAVPARRSAVTSSQSDSARHAASQIASGRLRSPASTLQSVTRNSVCLGVGPTCLQGVGQLQANVVETRRGHCAPEHLAEERMGQTGLAGADRCCGCALRDHEPAPFETIRRHLRTEVREAHRWERFADRDQLERRSLLIRQGAHPERDDVVQALARVEAAGPSPQALVASATRPSRARDG